MSVVTPGDAVRDARPPAPPLRKRVRWLLEAAGVSLLVGFFCLLPRRWAHAVGRRLGFWTFHLSRRSRRVALENLDLMLGVRGAEARRIAKESLKLAGASVADLLRAPRMTRLTTRRFVEIPDATWKALDAIRRGGKGAVLACSHLGNWELANLSAPYGGWPPMTVIVRPLPNPWLNRIVYALRSRTGQKLLHRHGAATECLQRVRNGEIVAITFDLPVPPDSGAIPVDFFGRPTFTTVAVGYVAAMTGAPVYLTHFEPLGRARYRFVLQGPLDAPVGETLRGTAAATTRRVSAALESAIRVRPDAWGWWLKRWSIRPRDAAETYPSYHHGEEWFWPRGTKPRRDYLR